MNKTGGHLRHHHCADTDTQNEFLSLVFEKLTIHQFSLTIQKISLESLEQKWTYDHSALDFSPLIWTAHQLCRHLIYSAFAYT